MFAYFVVLIIKIECLQFMKINVKIVLIIVNSAQKDHTLMLKKLIVYLIQMISLKNTILIFV